MYCLFGTLHRAFGVIQSGFFTILQEEFDSEVKKKGCREEQIVLKEISSIFFYLYFSYFSGVSRYKIDGPMYYKMRAIVSSNNCEHCVGFSFNSSVIRISISSRPSTGGLLQSLSRGSIMEDRSSVTLRSILSHVFPVVDRLVQAENTAKSYPGIIRRSSLSKLQIARESSLILRGC